MCLGSDSDVIPTPPHLVRQYHLHSLPMLQDCLPSQPGNPHRALPEVDSKLQISNIVVVSTVSRIADWIGESWLLGVSLYFFLQPCWHKLGKDDYWLSCFAAIQSVLTHLFSPLLSETTSVLFFHHSTLSAFPSDADQAPKTASLSGYTNASERLGRIKRRVTGTQPRLRAWTQLSSEVDQHIEKTSIYK